jgi:hypothetical protein
MTPMPGFPAPAISVGARRTSQQQRASFRSSGRPRAVTIVAVDPWLQVGAAFKQTFAALEALMHDELYTDGVEEITIGGSIVRVDLVSLSPTERDANNAPKKVFRQRLIFSVESFANSVEVMQNALQGLVDAGAVRRNPPKAPTGPAQTPSTEPPSSPRSPNVSSNFR